jgi:transcriptional regulator with XRE-family HTH domain
MPGPRSEIREAQGKTQSQMAKVAGMKQPSWAKLEGQSDMLISTLHKVIHAMGGHPGSTTFARASSLPASTQPLRPGPPRVTEIVVMRLVEAVWDEERPADGLELV